MLVLRLFLFVSFIAVVATFGVYFITGDRRYLRFSAQILKFSLILILVAAVIITMGRIVMF
jgi:hypothetical protein